MSEELKPCPMCGAEIAQNDDGMYWHPHGSCILSGIEFRDVEAWNQRAKPVVKALPWAEDAGPHAHAMGYRENADSALGRYWVENHENSGEWRTYFDGIDGDEIIDVNDTEDDAKAAAQADFTRRVLTCLEGYDD